MASNENENLYIRTTDYAGRAVAIPLDDVLNWASVAVVDGRLVNGAAHIVDPIPDEAVEVWLLDIYPNEGGWESREWRRFGTLAEFRLVTVE